MMQATNGDGSLTPGGSVGVVGLEWIVVVKLSAKRTSGVLGGIVELILSFWDLDFRRAG